MSDKCSRCDATLKGWEDGWPNCGDITLGCASQIFNKLISDEAVAGDEEFKWWHMQMSKKRHPVIQKIDAQLVVLKWAGGLGEKYRICYRCQNELIRLIGKFFRFGEEK